MPRLKITVASARPSSLEQQVDLAAVYKRFSELSSAGDYAAALVEGKKLAPAVQGTVRAHHIKYAVVSAILRPCTSGWGTPARRGYNSREG